MKKKFTAQVIDFKPVNEIPGAWSTDHYKKLLAGIGMDDGLTDLSDKEIKELCYMSLNELDHADAAKVVLTYLFSDEELSEGKIEQLSHDLVDEKMWEQFSDLLFHHRLFNAYSILRSAYNGIFVEPTGAQLTLKVIAEEADDLTIFDHDSKASLVRLLSQGMDENVTLNRLYSDQIAGDEFPEAEGIIWLLEELSSENDSRTFLITSSSFWLDDLKELAQFDAEIFAKDNDDEE